MMHNKYDAYVEKTRSVPTRRRKNTFIDVLYAVNLILVGVVAGVALCKFWPPFWHWLNSGWMESPWVPRAMFTVGAVCITVARCIEEDK